MDEPVAQLWGRLDVPDPLPAVDGLLAATAIVHDLTLVTPNVRDVARTGARLLDPFQHAGRKWVVELQPPVAKAQVGRGTEQAS